MFLRNVYLCAHRGDITFPFFSKDEDKSSALLIDADNSALLESSEDESPQTIRKELACRTVSHIAFAPSYSAYPSPDTGDTPLYRPLGFPRKGSQ